MKRKQAAAAAAAAAIAAAGIVTGVIFRFTFFFSQAQRSRIGYPRGSQYQPYRESSRKLMERIRELPGEECQILSDDGLRLWGTYYHQADGAPLEIMFHGYHGAAERDFCGGFWLAREAGHNILLVDERAHGRSEGRVITFGIKERCDCLAWARYGRARFGRETPIILAGVSMGAAAVLMASDLDLPENVRGIIADCGYSSPEAIIKKVAADRKIPAALYPFARLGARLFGGFDLEESSPKVSLKNCRVPVLLIHGQDDRFVPCRMSLENYRACAADKTLFTVLGAGHTLCCMVDPEGYRRTVNEFYQKIHCRN